jgi:hypothetical protein
MGRLTKFSSITDRPVRLLEYFIQSLCHELGNSSVNLVGLGRAGLGMIHIDGVI